MMVALPGIRLPNLMGFHEFLPASRKKSVGKHHISLQQYD